MDLLAWGRRRGYPALLFPPYGIGPGEYCWRMFCGLAKPEALAAAGEYIAVIDKQEQATAHEQERGA